MTRPTVLNYVTTPYGKKGSWAAGYHTGIDYRAPVGTPIYATRRGKVVHSGYGASGNGAAYGNHVAVHSMHRGRKREHSYNHLSKNVVKAGDRVKAGDLIGYSGETGNTFGAHLHYEERFYPFKYWDHYKPVLPEWEPLRKRILRKLRRLGVVKK